MKANKVDYQKSLFPRMKSYLRKKIWALIVAYMVGIHNFYKGEDKMPDDIVLTIEDDQPEEDSAPKD